MKKFMQGFFWGSFFGGLAGLMNAPRKGSETRKNIKEWIELTTDDVNDVRYKVDNLRLAIERLSNESVSLVDETTKDIQVSIRHFQEEASPRFKRIQNQVENLKENIQEANIE